MLRRAFVLATLLCGVLALTSRGDSVLIVGAPADPSWNTDVQNKLLGTGKFTSVDIFNAVGGTPSLSLLDNYSAVLAYTDSGAADPASLGNNLAAYVNQGHGLVLAVFANATGYVITGNLQTGGYYPIIPDVAAAGPDLHLGTVYDPTSPILAGVTSFDGGASSFRDVDSGGLQAGAARIADWSDGTPLVATLTKGSGRVVGLNFYPPSSTVRSDFWTSSTNGALLMANSLQFAANDATVVPTPSVWGGGLALCALVALTSGRRRRHAAA
jgi:MYXO-CTERM domain-containing protein